MRTAAVITSLVLLTSAPVLAQNWPHWRGPTMDGVSAETGVPTRWSKVCASPTTRQATLP